MKAWFDSQMVIGTDKDGKELPPKAIVFFHLYKDATTQPAIPYTFDGPATEAHKKAYPGQWKIFEEGQVSPEMREASKPPTFIDKLIALTE